MKLYARGGSFTTYPKVKSIKTFIAPVKGVIKKAKIENGIIVPSKYSEVFSDTIFQVDSKVSFMSNMKLITNFIDNGYEHSFAVTMQHGSRLVVKLTSPFITYIIYTYDGKQTNKVVKTFKKSFDPGIKSIYENTKIVNKSSSKRGINFHSNTDGDVKSRVRALASLYELDYSSVKALRIDLKRFGARPEDIDKVVSLGGETKEVEKVKYFVNFNVKLPSKLRNDLRELFYLGINNGMDVKTPSSFYKYLLKFKKASELPPAGKIRITVKED